MPQVRAGRECSAHRRFEASRSRDKLQPRLDCDSGSSVNESSAEARRRDRGRRLAIADRFWHRAFSGPEALVFELMIARALADIVTPELAPHARGRVLDVGAGGGTVAARLALNGGCEVVAVDPSRAQVRRIERRAALTPGLLALPGSAHHLDFDDESFDSVISSCAWKHWPDPARGVDECMRVLRPGGTILIIEIDGTVTREEFWSFAKSSDVPFGMRHAYLGFSMRTVVRAAPGPDVLAASFGEHPVEVRRLEGAPFLLARAQRRRA